MNIHENMIPYGELDSKSKVSCSNRVQTMEVTMVVAVLRYKYEVHEYQNSIL